MNQIEEYYQKIVEEYETKDQYGYSLKDVVAIEGLMKDDILKTIMTRYEKNEEDHDVMIVFGGPKTGKTTLCKRAVYSFKKGKWNNQIYLPNHVLYFSLNSALWNYQKGDIAYALCNRPMLEAEDLSEMIPLEDLRNSIIFLDDYEQFYTKRKTNSPWKHFNDFYDHLFTVAKQYNIFFVLMVSENLPKEEYDAILKKQNAPFGKNWSTTYFSFDCRDYLAEVLNKTAYIDYLVNHGYLTGLMEDANILFNNVYLYYHVLLNEKLNSSNRFMEHTGEIVNEIHQMIDGNDRSKQIHQQLTTIAYEIYKNNEYTCIYNRPVLSNVINAYWIDSKNQEVSFIDSSIYQYYLAHALLKKLVKGKTKKNIELYLQSLSYQPLSHSMLKMMKQVYHDYYINTIFYQDYYSILDTLAFSKNTLISGSILQSDHMVMNAVNVFTQVFDLPANNHVTLGNHVQEIVDLLKRTKEKNISLAKLYFERIDFSRMELEYYDFYQSECFYCNFSYSKIWDTNFCGANLLGSRMYYADLSDNTFLRTSIDFVDFTGTEINMEVIQEFVECGRFIQPAYGIELIDQFNYGILLGEYQNEALKARILDYDQKQNRVLVISDAIIDVIREELINQIDIIDFSTVKDYDYEDFDEECKFELNTEQFNQYIDGILEEMNLSDSIEIITLDNRSPLFLLSRDEFNQYFISKEEARSKVSSQWCQELVYTSYFELSRLNRWMLLIEDDQIEYVDSDGKNGTMFAPNQFSETIGFRPACYIKIKK